MDSKRSHFIEFGTGDVPRPDARIHSGHSFAPSQDATLPKSRRPRRIEVRRAKCSDSPQIARLLRTAFAEFESKYTAAGFAATVLTPAGVNERMKEGPIWVALLGSSIIGTVSARLRAESVYLRGMAVLPCARRMGVADRLLASVERYTQGRGLRSLFLATTPFLKAAITFYERRGFRPVRDDGLTLFGTPLIKMHKGVAIARPVRTSSAASLSLRKPAAETFTPK